VAVVVTAYLTFGMAAVVELVVSVQGHHLVFPLELSTQLL
jgi:hypothetical protein